MRPMKQTRHNENATALMTQKLCSLRTMWYGRTRFSPRMPAAPHSRVTRMTRDRPDMIAWDMKKLCSLTYVA